MDVTLRMVHLVVTVYVYLHKASQHEGKTFQYVVLFEIRQISKWQEQGIGEGDIFNLKNNNNSNLACFCTPWSCIFLCVRFWLGLASPMEYISINSGGNIFTLPVAFSVSMIVRPTTQQFLEDRGNV